MKISYKSLIFVSTLIVFCNCASEEDESEGAFIFSSMYEGFCERDERKQGKSPYCQDGKLTSFLEPLQVTNPESIIALATKYKLQKVCSNTSKTIDEMEKYLKTCSLQPGQGIYNNLLRGISALHKKLCSKDRYQKLFLEFKKCYGRLQSEFNSCNGTADWSESTDEKIVCKVYQEVVDCYYTKTSELCGNKAADVFKELVKAVVDSVITVDCSICTTLGRESKNLTSLENSSGIANSVPRKVSYIICLYAILYIFIVKIT